ncbi:hypothetical protein Bca52824_077090 [Brassica carinata]|uniref:No apical meristem-associated C-terminal domain-containing protein n=1 Tax=Brassica carinata TaxID=52824 RepID=A0A8X7TZQ1_BRACI|nr:hypothetical protein Bca52824_077090 [Brassica carinata]
MDPFSQPCSFQSHLNSQHQNTQHPYQSVPREPSIELSASDASVFGSQWTEDGNEDAETSKRSKLDDQSAQSSTSVAGSHGEDEGMARPVGVKAAKAKGKKSMSKPATLEEERREFQSMWEIRQKDYALKKKLNKQKLLYNLIANTEPLSELEIALKNKLINDMMA